MPKFAAPDTSGMFLEQRVERLESFCTDLLSMLSQQTERKVELSRTKIAKMKADMKESVRKKSLAKRKPIKRRRK